MTTEEKCGQLQYRVHVLDDASETHDTLAEEAKIVRSGLGNMFLSSRVSAGETARRLNRIQKTAREQTRLGIPVLVHGKSLRGLLSHDATMFPQPLTLAATFDRDLTQRVFAAIAKESRSRGFHMSYSPVVDLGTDPRWGRIVETFGEDPYLVSEIGIACVTGYQHRKGRYRTGRGFQIEADDDVIDTEHIACTAKHFAGYGQCQGGRNFGPYNYSQQFLREHVYLPFKHAVERVGHGASTVSSYPTPTIYTGWKCFIGSRPIQQTRYGWRSRLVSISISCAVVVIRNWKT